MSAFTLEELAVGQRATHGFRISDADMSLFAQLSGDLNPLHQDETFAAAKGFDRRVVYGGLLIAKISKLLGMDLPGRNGVWLALHLNFRKPLYVEEDAEIVAEIIEISEGVQLVVIGLKVIAAGRLLAEGRAEVIVTDEAQTAATYRCGCEAVL